MKTEEARGKIEELQREIEGLKEYSASRDESIKVYQQEIKDLEEKLGKAEELTKGGWVKSPKPPSGRVSAIRARHI